MKKNIFFFSFFLLVFTGGFFIAYGYTQNPIKPFVNKDVILEATCYDLRGQLATCKNSGKKTVTDNGIHTINYRDFTDTSKSENIEVNWIDKTLPKFVRTAYSVEGDTESNGTPPCTNKNIVAKSTFFDANNRTRLNDRISRFSIDNITTFFVRDLDLNNTYGDKRMDIRMYTTFTNNEQNREIYVQDLAGNQSIRKYITINSIDRTTPTIQNFSIDKNGDSTLRMGGTYPIVFTVNDSRPTGCTDQSIFFDIYIQKDGEVLGDQSQQRQTTTIGSTVRNNTITFVGNGKYGIFLRIRDTAGNEVSQSLGYIDNANIPSPVDSVPITTGPSISMDDVLGVKIIGTYQGQGKDQQILAGQEANMTLVQASSIRDSIRKNAYILIRNRNANDGKIIGGVKYVTGNYEYTEADNGESYSTLIVKDGDLLIKNNVTKNRGFIVLDESITGSGNIIVSGNVTDIKGVLFAEGKLDGDRTSMKQLRILGSILTRNTIGGSILKNGSYILPGNKSTNDGEIAKIYDLNLLRGKNDDWDLNGDGLENGNEFKNATLLIRYNTENTTNPPPGFGQ